jgi:hypothetical protein
MAFPRITIIEMVLTLPGTDDGYRMACFVVHGSRLPIGQGLKFRDFHSADGSVKQRLNQKTTQQSCSRQVNK